MTAKDVISETASLVETQPEKFDFVHRLALERALFALAKEFAASQFDFALSGFSGDALQDLTDRSANDPLSNFTVDLFNRILHKIKLISSGDPYITLDGHDMMLEGRREIIVSLKEDLIGLLKQLDANLERCLRLSCDSLR